MSTQECPTSCELATSPSDAGDLEKLESCFVDTVEPTIGVETEHYIEDQRNGRPLALFDDLFERLPGRIQERTHGEFLKCQIEYATHAHATVADIRGELQEFYEACGSAAHGFGARLSWQAVHANWEFDPTMIHDCERSRITVERFGSRMPHLATCSMHVHTAVGRAQAIPVCDGMQSFVPLLLAASANSLLRYGQHHAIQSRRGQSWGHTLSTLPFPLMFGDWAGFRRKVDQLQRAGLIQTQKCLYSFVRPTRFGTVENRVFDLPQNLTTAVGLAALNQALVVRIQEDPDFRVATEVLHSDLNRAIADGPHALLMTPARDRLPVSEYVNYLVEELNPIAQRLQSETALDRLQRSIDARCRKHALTAPTLQSLSSKQGRKRSWPRLSAAFVAGVVSAAGLAVW